MSTVLKPWGSYRDLHRTESSVVKIISVSPNQRLSLQVHQHRTERWVCVSGAGYCETRVNGIPEVVSLVPGTTVEIDRGVIHRLIAGVVGVEVVETQLGMCSEDDIERLEDDYDRAITAS